MAEYIFNDNDISQHMVKYGADVRPVITPKQDRVRMQNYCNWLVENLPEHFETIISGADRMEVRKVYAVDNNRIEMASFAMTARGPLFTFPKQLFGDVDRETKLVDIRDVFDKAMTQFKREFSGHNVLRVGCVNEIVFDCGNINPVEVIASEVVKERWHKGLNNIKIHLENPTEGFNVNVDIMPAYAQQVREEAAGKRTGVRFGISVNIDVNNRQVDRDLEAEEITAILNYSDDYLANGLVKFLNNEQ